MLKKLAMLLLSLGLMSAPAQATVQEFHSGGVPSNQLWMPPGPGAGFLPQNIYAADANHLAFATRSFVGTSFAPTMCQLFLIGIYWVNSTETLPGNDVAIDYAQEEDTLNSFQNITFSGSQGGTLTNGGVLASDPFPVNVGADSGFHIIIAGHVTLGQNVPVSFHTVDLGSGEGAVYSATNFSPGTQNIGGQASGSSFSHVVQPAAVVCNGYDGRPVGIGLGDSILIANQGISITGRKTWSAWDVAMDDSATGRIPFLNWGVSGSSGVLMSSSNTGFLSLVAAIKAAHNIPGTFVFSEMGRNDGNLPLMRADYYPFLQATFTSPHNGLPLPITQTTLAPRTLQTTSDGVTTTCGSPSLCSGYADAANNIPNSAANVYPTGQLYVFNLCIAALNCSGNNPSYSIDISTAMQDAAGGFPDHWQGGEYTGTLFSGVVGNVSTSAVLTGACPPLYTNLVFEPYVNNDITNDYTVGTATFAAGNCTVNLISNSVNNASKIAITHLAGTTVASRKTGDGSHPDTKTHNFNIAPIIEAFKNKIPNG